MKATFTFTLISIIGCLACHAQGKYQVSGRVAGIADGSEILLVRDDGAKPDTLATAVLKNGTLFLSGELDVPAAGGYLASADGVLHVPLIVEPANIMLNVSMQGALLQGGKQQELFARYNQIGQAYAAAQAQLQAQARQTGADLDALQAQMNHAYRESVEQANALIQANADEYATAYVIALGALNETEESLQQKYGLLGDAAKASVPGKRIAAALDRFAKLAVGKVAPDFAATRPNGDTFSLYGVPAKYKLLVFWASDDAASRQANPSLIRLYQQFRPRGLEIVGISLDGDLMAWRRAIEQDGISIWTNGSDLEGRSSGIASLYMVGASLPYTVLIGEENKIVAKGLLGDDLTRQLDDLTKKRKK